MQPKGVYTLAPNKYAKTEKVFCKYVRTQSEKTALFWKYEEIDYLGAWQRLSWISNVKEGKSIRKKAAGSAKLETTHLNTYKLDNYMLILVCIWYLTHFALHNMPTKSLAISQISRILDIFRNITSCEKWGLLGSKIFFALL